ncbi:MAG: PadR family transcriptional regulator [Chloroflexi bacterium]|nr:PadR family transcriptional regulator [Chloroflexota bacterium]
MPHGPGWRGGGRKGPCPRRISRFVEPCLLLLLRRDESHGYDLLTALQEFGFGDALVDSSAVYRTLRDLEGRGFVASTWEIGGQGPPRRVYRVTAEGEAYLDSWVSELRQTDRLLHNLLEAYDEYRRQGK